MVGDSGRQRPVREDGVVVAAAQVFDGFVLLSKLQQPGDDVQFVGKFVRLGAECLRHVHGAVAVAQDGVELRAVAQDQHLADFAAVDGGRIDLAQQDPFTREHQFLRGGSGREQAEDRRFQACRCRGPGDVPCQGEQAACLIVDQRDPAVGVHGHQSFTQAVEHGVARFQQGSDVLGLEFVDPPPHQFRDIHRAQRT
ncbi:hypothetical protein SRABI128_05759 [Microbacterium sp. Bi128]|nr:hypothetical protein SRABI128_05759 [Microbacterium sp. Bi128]